MIDRLEAMSVFATVVEAGSLSAAGRALGMPLPSVSRKLAELEAHLGTRLLIRSTRRLDLTDAGRDYLAAVRLILEQVGDAERAAAGEYQVPRGDLTVTAPVVFGRWHVLPVITQFLAAFPEVAVRLVLSDRNAQLIDDHIDVALRIGVLPDSSMVAVRLGAVRRVVCGAPSFFARHGTPRTPADLAALTCVTFDALGSPASWSFVLPGTARRQPVAIRSRLSVNTAEAAIDAAIAGVGVTRVLSYQAARGLSQGTLEVVLEAFEREPMPVSLVHAAQGELPLKARRFLDFAAPRLRAALAGGAAGDAAAENPAPS